MMQIGMVVGMGDQGDGEGVHEDEADCESVDQRMDWVRCSAHDADVGYKYLHRHVNCSPVTSTLHN